jgi:hypothetical protein
VGPARRCGIRQARIGGFQKQRDAKDVTEEASVWIAPLFPGALPVPVRFEFDTGWGWAVVLVTAGSNGGATRGPSSN